MEKSNKKTKKPVSPILFPNRNRSLTAADRACKCITMSREFFPRYVKKKKRRKIRKIWKLPVPCEMYRFFFFRSPPTYLFCTCDSTKINIFFFLYSFQPFQESQLMPPVFTGASVEQEMRNVTILGSRPCVPRWWRYPIADRSSYFFFLFFFYGSPRVGWFCGMYIIPLINCNILRVFFFFFPNIHIRKLYAF